MSMWLIARRSFAQDWARLTATVLAVLFSVGLMSGSLQFALRAESAVSGSDASEYAKADVLVQPPGIDPEESFAVPRGEVRPGAIASVPGVAAVAGDAAVPVTVIGAHGRPVLPPAGAATMFRPWISDARLSAYHLVAGRAPAADDEVAVVRHVATAGRLGTGATTTLLLPKTSSKVRIVGVVTVQGRGAVASGDLVLGTPAAVHRAAGLAAGAWQSLWVKAAPGVPAGDLRNRLAAPMRPAVVRTASDLRRHQAAELQDTGASVGGAIGMLASVAVFTGLFVVANAFGTMVRQRTRRLALLAAIGARPRQIRRLVRLEALVLAVIASAGGLLVGYGVAEVLTRLFAQDGFDISAGEVSVGWIALAFPFAAGVVTTQLAAWRPARRASKVAPIEALRSATAEKKGRTWPRIVGALAVFGASWMFFGPVFAVANDPTSVGTDRTVGITVLILLGSMVCVSGLAVLAPFFVGPLGGLVGRLGMLVSGEAGRLARATITRSPRRVSSAAASLMLGVALVAATGLLITSVHDRSRAAGAQTLAADHVIAGNGRTSGGAAPLPADLAARAARVPGVTAAVALTQTEVRLVSPKIKAFDSDPGMPIMLTVTGASDVRPVLRFGGHLPLLRPGEIGVTSPLVKAYGLRPGRRIVVHGARGDVTLTVAGRYHDPSHLFADQALVAPATMATLDPGANTSAVLVRGTAPAAALAAAVSDVPVARVYDRAAYVRVAAAAMEQGVRVIYGFIAMSLLIALFGMATTVSLSVSERTREFGMLGAVGTTVRQIRSIVRWEAATVVLLGVLLGMGVAVGTVALLHVATGSSYIRVHLPWWLLATVVLGAAAVTWATSALPARRAAGVPVLEAAKAE
ncbi:FtsX-like permease family protein [Actinoallomurus rhizosphaericola]|uniref:FtsX-like permease family protein n=1 Tax=Actinoallomurus rhizosphaericola TaxID=2952536 RepID=UPI0020918FAF|nr:FtsX family ABC transporter permease [Actinoallomurus rhizosphaericola]MCO5992589.1 ABC transporter permease [Actinoallomurus rhizosphaericola]